MVKRKISRRAKSVVRNVNNMMPKSSLNAYSFANALGITGAIALLFYAVMSWFGSYDSTMIIAKFPLYFSMSNWTLIIGLIQTYVMLYIAGWIFVKIYNKYR